MKPIIWNKIILALGVSIATTGALADDNTSATNQSPATVTSQQFVSDAATGGMKEIYLSELALQQSQDSGIKDFARHMVKDHSSANKKLMKIADDEGLNFPPTNTFSMDDPNWNNQLIASPQNIKGAQMLTIPTLPYLTDYRAVRSLKSLAGGEFDQAYLNDMVNDHIQAVNAFEMASQNLADPKLKKFAGKTLPTLRKHSRMAQALQNKLGGMQNTNSAGAYGTNSNSGTQVGSWPLVN